MARPSSKPDDLAVMVARRDELFAEAALIDEQVKAAELAARDAGRPILLSALERVKIPSMERAEARTIAKAIGQHGGKAIAAHLSSIQPS